MEEYQDDAEWYDKTNGESPHSEKRDANRSSICKLISYQLFSSISWAVRKSQKSISDMPKSCNPV